MKKSAVKGQLKILYFSVIIFLLIITAVHFSALYFGNRGLITFDKGNAGFEPVGEPSGTTFADSSPPDSDNKLVALRYSYETQVDQYSGIGAMGMSLNGFTALKIRIFSEKERTMGVVVDEEETGAHYVYSFKAPAGKWIEETCPPDLFMLSPGSSDSNNLLDTASLNSRLLIVDMSGFKGILGPNTFWVSRIEILKEKNPPKERK